MDVFELELASDVQISPDGRRVAFVRTSFDVMTDRARGNLWVVDSAGGNARPLRLDRQSCGSPRWSPDGTRLAYLASEGEHTQLHVRWMDTGQTALITNLTEAPGDLAWSPDGRWIAFTAFVPKEKEPLAKPPSPPKGADWAPPVTVIDTVVYRVDGAGYLESGYTHLFLVSAEGGTPRQLTRGEFNDEGPLSFTPDGKTLAFSANRNPDWEYDFLESEVWTVSVLGGEPTRLTTRKGPDASPVVSPDGKRIAYLGFDDREQGYQVTQLYVMDRDGRNPRALTASLDRDVVDPQWSSDGGSLTFAFDDRGVRKIGRATLDGRVASVVSGLGGTDLGRPYTSGSYSLARDGRVAFTLGTPWRPADVAVASGRGEPLQLTHLNDDLLGAKTLGAVQPLRWKSSHDGREIEGWLVTPPGFDPTKKYPLLLEIHGGPFAAYGPNWTAEIQLYAAAGYVVLYANPRGSTSYGEEFGNLIHHAYPGYDYDDLMSGVDAAIAHGSVDPDQLYVTGGSGGGVLTAWIVGKTHRFRAAAVAKPVINWTSFALTSDFTSFFERYWFASPPWQDAQEYWRRSPLSLVGNVTTPTLLLTGEQDYRTPISESEQFYQALKLRKVDTALVRVPGASHELVDRPSHLIAKVENILGWFEKHRGDAGQASP